MADLRMPDMGKTVQLKGLAGLSLCGIYFLLQEEVVVYIGQAHDIRSRLGGHLTEGAKEFDAIAFVECAPDRLNGLERAYIEKLVPKYNRCHFTNMLRLAGVESSTGGRLVSEPRKIRIPRQNARRTVHVLV